MSINKVVKKATKMRQCLVDTDGSQIYFYKIISLLHLSLNDMLL